ncbi:hypothetical protein ACFC3W_08140 [Enterococcus durans]|uniref:hypothetical protein n=1 Tax=Enterococcus durans TaxID=53345 RepID=UPI0039A67ECE
MKRTKIIILIFFAFVFSQLTVFSSETIAINSEEESKINNEDPTRDNQSTSSSEEASYSETVSINNQEESNINNKGYTSEHQTTLSSESVSNSETMPIDSEEKSRMINKNMVSIDEEWEQINTLEEGSIDMQNSRILHYYFGSHSRIGSTTILPKPSFSLNDNGKEIYDFYRPNNNLNSLRNNHNTILAYGNTSEDSPTTSNIEDLEPDNNTIHYYKKLDANGTSFLIEYVSTSATGGVIQVIITMEALPNKLVRITTSYTNIGETTFQNAVMGSSYDTKLGTNDKVPVYYIGNNKGVYIKDAQYRLEFRMSNIPNWAVGTYLQENARWIRDFFNESKTTFSNLSSSGFESRNGAAGSVALENVDSAIHFKTQPQNFAPGEKIEMSFDAGILTDDGKPIVELDKHYSEFTKETKETNINGSWRDSDSESVQIYYQLDEDTPVLIGEYGNMISGEDYQFDFSLNTTKLTPERHTLKVYGVDSDGNMSNVEEYILDYMDTGILTFKEVPSMFDFGVHRVSDTTQEYLGKNVGDLVIKDTRSINKGYWQLTLKQTKILNDNNNELSNILYFDDGTKLTSLNAATVISSQKLSSNTEEYNVSNEWDNLGKGLKAIVKPSDQLEGTYTGNLEWTLQNVVENQ